MCTSRDLCFAGPSAVSPAHRHGREASCATAMAVVVMGVVSLRVPEWRDAQTWCGTLHGICRLRTRSACAQAHARHTSEAASRQVTTRASGLVGDRLRGRQAAREASVPPRSRDGSMEATCRRPGGSAVEAHAMRYIRDMFIMHMWRERASTRVASTQLGGHLHISGSGPPCVTAA